MYKVQQRPNERGLDLFPAPFIYNKQIGIMIGNDGNASFYCITAHYFILTLCAILPSGRLIQARSLPRTVSSGLRCPVKPSV